MWQDFRAFLNWHANDWAEAQPATINRALIGATVFVAIVAGLCAL